jgi:hypothetical protein
MPRIRRPSPGLVVACLALAIALSGTAVAASVALAPNSVGTAQLKSNAVTTAKVKNGSLLRADFKAGQVRVGPAGPPGPTGPAGAAGPAGPAGPSDAFARFLAGPIAIPGIGTTIVNLTIPEAGKYVISSKAFVSGAVAASALCRLVAGTDQDDSLGNGLQFTLANLLTHEFAAAGSVDFRCNTGGAQTVAGIRIVAIRVGNLSAS